MSTYIPQPNDMLHAWIDGELDPGFEAQFFTLLASDADLREKLRQMRGIREEAQKFGGSVQPPAEITDSVFSRLGFAAPPPIVSGRRTSELRSTLDRAWAPLASAAAAAVITAMLILGLRDTVTVSDIPELAANQHPASTEQVISTPPSGGITAPDGQDAVTDSRNNSGSAQADTPQRSASADNGRSSMRANFGVQTESEAGIQPENRSAAMNEDIAEIPVLEYAGDTFSSENPSADDAAGAAKPGMNAPASRAKDDGSSSIADGTTSASDEQSNPGSDSEEESHRGTSLANSQNPSAVNAWNTTAANGASNALRETPDQSGSASVDTRRFFPNLLPGEQLHSISLEFRGMNTASFPNVTMNTASRPWMENMAVAVFYSSGQEDYGIEFGQEPYSQHFQGVEYGRVVRYEQNLLTPWLMATWRHRFDGMSALGSVVPYISTSVGTALYYWPMARTGAGVMYMPDRRVRFQLGIEGSIMAYPYQDSWFTSRRFGLTYGLAVLF